jgi:hypothetical protein
MQNMTSARHCQPVQLRRKGKNKYGKGETMQSLQGGTIGDQLAHTAQLRDFRRS